MSYHWLVFEAISHPVARTTMHRAPDLGSAAARAPPPPGRAVLACRCGVMLDLNDMHRPDRRADRNSSGIRIEPICCARCARDKRMRVCSRSPVAMST
jgi:hypothetical protein